MGKTGNLYKKVENIILTKKLKLSCMRLLNTRIQIAPLLNTHWHYIEHVVGMMKNMKLHNIFKSKLKK